MYCELHSRVFISVIGTCFFSLMNRSLWYILMYNIVLIEQKFLCSVRRDNRILYLFFKWSFLVNTALWVYSTNQIMTVIQNHSCKMETVDPVLEVACSAKVSCICAVKTTTRWTSAHLVCSLVLSLSFSFTHTNTHTHLLQAVQTLWEDWGGGWLTSDELTMGMTSPWPQCSSKQPTPTV